MLHERQGRFPVTIKEFFAGASLGVHKGDGEDVIAKALDMADSDGLVGEDSPHDSADDDVLQLEHGTRLSREAGIVKPLVAHPDPHVRGFSAYGPRLD